MADTEVIYYCGGNDKPPPIGDPVYSSIQLFAARVREGIRASWSINADIPWGVAYVTLYRSTGPTWSDSMPALWSGGANQYLDNVDNLETDTTYYYWIIVTSVNGTDSIRVGPESAVMRPWLNQALDDLKNSIRNSELNQELQDQIKSISSFQSGLDLLGEEYAFINAASAAAMDAFRLQLEAEGVARIADVYKLTSDVANAVYLIDGIGATFNKSFAAIITEQAVYAGSSSALAKEVKRLEASIDGENGEPGLSALVQQASEAVVDLEKGVSANYTVKVEANNRFGGVVAGFGLAVTDEEDINSPPTSTFIVRADRFALLPSTPSLGPSDPNEGNASVPFIVADGKTYIESAFIQEASIDTLKVDGNAITAGYSAEKEFANKTGYNDFWRVTGSIPYSEHLGGRIKIEVSMNLKLTQNGANGKPGCQVEIFFDDTSGGSIERVGGWVQSEPLNLEMPIGFQHTSKGNTTTGVIQWECSIRPASGLSYTSVTKPAKCWVTRTITKR